MRFDLTHAAFRVLERTGFYVLPDSPSEITSAKVLLALLEEEDCRAADWLAQEGITLESFCRGFGLENTVFNPSTAVLQSSVKREDTGYIRSNPKGKRFSVYKGYHPAAYSSNSGTKARFYLDDQKIKINRLAKELESSLEIVAAQCSHYSVRQGRSLEERRQIPLNLGIMSVSTQDGSFTASGEPLATEHLLLAAAMDENDTGKYLREHNLEPTALFDRIAKQNQKHSFGYFEIEGETAEGEYKLESEPAAAQTILTDNDNQRSVNYSVNNRADKNNEPKVITADIYRLLDAAANRARESCRVIEDYVRFILNLPELTQTLKSFRHRLQSILSELPPEQLLASRDTENDIGTSLEAEGEYLRSGTKAVLSANFSRLQESLRTLEEFSKIETPSIAKRLEQLRYESYTVQKNILQPSGCISDIVADIDSITDIANAYLYILLDCRKDETTFTETANALINGGTDVIQLRDKTADDRTLLERGKLLRQLIDSSEKKPLFIMNDRPDLAVLLNADGVHIGQNELPVAEVRKIIGNKLIGVSTHSIEQVRNAVADGADYIGVGPVFLSSTKNFAQIELAGTELLRTAAEELSEKISIPAFAIGGITLENLDEVLQTGIKRIAVSSAVINADNPQEVAKVFCEIHALTLT